MQNSDEDIKHQGTGWQSLWWLVGKQKKRLILALLAATIAAVLELVPFWLLFLTAEQLLQVMQQQMTLLLAAENLYQLALWMLAALLVKTLVYGIAYYLSHQAAFLVLAETRRTLVNRLAWAPLSWLQGQHSGQLKQMVLQDVARIENLIAHHGVELTVAVLSPLLVTGYLFWLDWRLALAALAVAPLAVLSSMFFMRGMDQQYDAYQQRLTVLNNTILEYLRNRTAMKLFLQDSQRFTNLVSALERYYDLVAGLTRRTVPRWALFTSLLGANLLLILPVGHWLWQQQELELNTLIMALLLSGGMLRPLLKVSHFFSESKEALAGIRRMAPVLAMPDRDVSHTDSVGSAHIDISGGNVGSALDSSGIKLSGVSVHFQQLSFAYPEQDLKQNIGLKQIDLTLSAGSSTLLLGASGSGKSTLAQLLAGLLVPTQGRILINDIDLACLNNQQRSQLIAVATQEAFLFKGTIRQNLMLARENISEQALLLAVQVAQAESLIEQLPDGYDTQLEELGGRLSGGERQRIALARALLADTPVLVLDEATAFADNLTQQAFYLALQCHYPHKTLLIIAHHLAGLQQVDQIVLLDQGRVQAIGDHSCLLADNPAYQRLWTLHQHSYLWSLRPEKDGEACFQAEPVFGTAGFSKFELGAESEPFKPDPNALQGGGLS